MYRFEIKWSINEKGLSNDYLKSNYQFRIKFSYAEISMAPHYSNFAKERLNLLTICNKIVNRYFEVITRFFTINNQFVNDFYTEDYFYLS